MYEKIRYGSFTFPINPRVTELEHNISFAEHKYIGLNGSDIEPLGSTAPIIKLDGVLVDYDDANGNTITAKQQFSDLRAVFRKGEVQEFYHPVWYGTCNGLMTKCTGKVEPQVGIISYTCEIVLDRGNGNTQSKGGKIKVKKTKTKTVTVTYKVAKNNQSLKSIVKKMNKKYESYKPKFTEAKVKKWNKSIKNWKKLKKGKKLTFKYTVTTYSYVYA